MSDFAGIEQSLGYRFRRPDVLRQALVHSSYAAEHGSTSNERLEFLGDAVLQLVVTEFAFEEWEDLPEGELAKVRAASVSGAQLAAVARSLALGDYLLLGRGEEASGGREKESILADAMEAVLAAVYLDGGLDAARRVVVEHWEDRIRASAVEPGGRDFKTRLQELLARRGMRPRYRIAEAGQDHEKTFTATVEMDGDVIGTGVGRSKKEAEQQAAAEALAKLER
jgi:ribonuclease-3